MTPSLASSMRYCELQTAESLEAALAGQSQTHMERRGRHSKVTSIASTRGFRRGFTHPKIEPKTRTEDAFKYAGVEACTLPPERFHKFERNRGRTSGGTFLRLKAFSTIVVRGFVPLRSINGLLDARSSKELSTGCAWKSCPSPPGTQEGASHPSRERNNQP